MALNEKPGLPFPLWLLAVDGFGALVFALGAVGHFANVGLLRALLPAVAGIDVLAMVIGGVMMGLAMGGIVSAMLRTRRRLAAGGPASLAQNSQPGLARAGRQDPDVRR